MLKNKRYLMLFIADEAACQSQCNGIYLDLVLFLAKYSFLLQDSETTQNSCASKTSQFSAPQGNGEIGTRYLDPKYSRWISVDPALGEYASGSDTGCGGIFNHVNMNVYHYGGNNPIKYTDPNGRADKAKTFIDITSSILFDSMSRENGDRRYISCFTQGFLTTGEQGDKIASRLGTVDALSAWTAIAILSPIRYHFDKSGNNFTVPEVGSNDYLVTAQNEIKTLNVLLDCYKDDVLFSDFLMDQKALLLYEIDANKKNLYQHFYPLDPFIKSNNGDFLSHENMSLSDWEMMFPERVSTLTDGGKILHHKSVNYIDAYRQYCNEYNRPEKFIEFCKKWRVVYE